MNRPLLIVVSAPSGAGKTTLCDRILDTWDSVAYSISCTTRAPRGKETDGVDYFFLSVEEFDKRVREGCFLEHAIVHGNRYGTLRDTVVQSLEAGRSILMDIDVQGAEQIRERVEQAPKDDILRKAFVDIFIAPPSLEALRERLLNRGEDTPEVIEIRLRNAAGEMAHSHEYRHIVVNDELDEAYEELVAVLDEEAHANE